VRVRGSGVNSSTSTSGPAYTRPTPRPPRVGAAAGQGRVRVVRGVTEVAQGDRVAFAMNARHLVQKPSIIKSHLPTLHMYRNHQIVQLPRPSVELRVGGGGMLQGWTGPLPDPLDLQLGTPTDVVLGPCAAGGVPAADSLKREGTGDAGPCSHRSRPTRKGHQLQRLGRRGRHPSSPARTRVRRSKTPHRRRARTWTASTTRSANRPSTRVTSICGGLRHAGPVRANSSGPVAPLDPIGDERQGSLF